MALWPTPQAKQGGGSMPPSSLYICGKLARSSFSALTFKQKVLAKALFCYNYFMEYITVVIDSFWLIMEQVTTIFVPIIVILLVFGIVKGLLFNER